MCEQSYLWHCIFYKHFGSESSIPPNCLIVVRMSERWMEWFWWGWSSSRPPLDNPGEHCTTVATIRTLFVKLCSEHYLGQNNCRPVATTCTAQSVQHFRYYTSQQYYSITFLWPQHYNITSTQLLMATTLQHYIITASRGHNITTLHHHSFTWPQHYNITSS